MSLSLSYADVLAARERLRALPRAQRPLDTPLLSSASLSALAARRHADALGGHPLLLLFKGEYANKTGSFKARGAANAVALVVAGDRGEGAARAAGVCTHSSGNFAAALAWAARNVGGVPALVIMPRGAPAAKRAATLALGGEIEECEATQAAREAAAAAAARRTGAAFVHPSEDARVQAGAGSIALEVLEAAPGAVELIAGAGARRPGAPAVDVLVVPVGGGGLIAGCATAARGADARVLVVGAEPAAADDAARSLARGEHVLNAAAAGGGAPATMADGLRTNLGPNTWPLVRELVPTIVTASEGGISRALRALLERLKAVVEPSAAVGFAAVCAPAFDAVLRRVVEALDAGGAAPNEPVVVAIVLCGGNVDLAALPALLAVGDADGDA